MTISGGYLDGESGAGIFNNEILTITNSIIRDNYTYNSNGYGGGIYNAGTVNITNSTVTLNRGYYGGGIYNKGTANITNSTIVASYSPAFEGDNIYSSGGATTTVTSSIIADGVNGNRDISGSFISGGNNLVEAANDGTGFTNGVMGDLVGIDPLLGGLGDNGGPTRTVALLPGSLAIDAGRNPDGLTTDQRGAGFARVVGSSADIGAFEFNNPPVAQNDGVSTDENTPVTINVIADNGNGVDSDPDGQTLTVTQVNGNAVTVVNPITLASGALLTLNSDGTFSYNPNSQFDSLAPGDTGTDSFNYTISDGNGGTDTATVTVTINGVDEPPVDPPQVILPAVISVGILIRTQRDNLSGGQGDDFLSGFSGKDTIFGNDGNDTLRGDFGRDLLLGGNDNDLLFGGRGRDTLDGGQGDDTLEGGFGRDLFVLRAGDGQDTILDYSDGIDKFNLDGLSFSQLEIFQGDNATVLLVESTEEVLASLVGVDASVIDAGDFISI